MAVDMFLELTNIKGEALDKTHKEKIDVLAWSWGASNSGTAHMGGGAGAGKANIQDLSITKYIDKSSPILFQHVATGAHIDEGVLRVRKAGTTPLEYVVITMTECLITSYSTGGSGGEDRLTENLSINFAKVKVEYTPQESKGQKGTAVDFTYNIAENTAA